MEAYGSVLVDQAVYAKRNNPSVPVFSSCCNNNSISDGFLRRSASQQLLSCHGAMFPGTRPPLYASAPPPPPTYRSLPPHFLQQPCPPLLPLPLSRSFSLPSPIPPVSARRVTAGAGARSANKDQKKLRPSPAKASQPGGRPHKEPPAASTSGGLPKSTVPVIPPVKDGAAKEAGDFTGDVYALSPPPSSLPMPRFSLRARAVPSSSPSPPRDEKALGGEIDAGASDDLRQLLRL